MESEVLKGENSQAFTVRRLECSDRNKGFIELLSNLTVCESISEEEFKSRFNELVSYGDNHVICVIDEGCTGKILATGSIFIEKKFIRNCGKVGHIEDVVVDPNFRGRNLGQKVIQYLTQHAKSMGCYKVILDCSVENRGFYEKCGFKKKEVQMAMYLI